MTHAMLSLIYPPNLRPPALSFFDCARLRQLMRAIATQWNFGGLGEEKWLIAPRAGDCNDYAVGWPFSDYSSRASNTCL